MDVCSRCLPLQLRKWLSQQYPIAMTDVPWWHSKFFSKFIDNKIERGRSKFVKANPQYKDNQRVRTVVLPWLSLDWDGWLRLLLCKTCCWYSRHCCLQAKAGREAWKTRRPRVSTSPAPVSHLYCSHTTHAHDGI